MHFEHPALMRRLERAQALTNHALHLSTGGASLPLGGGFAHGCGAGHPLSQALGLLDPVDPAELEAAEAFLGSPTVLEVCPAADPGLWPLLARRGYRVGQFQHQLARPLAARPEGAEGFSLRPIEAHEEVLLAKLLAAGFSDQDDWRDLDPPFTLGPGGPTCLRYLAFLDGEPAGGATLVWEEGVAFLVGDAVLPRFRGRGLQKALIRARLLEAWQRGCDLAGATTLPWSHSQRAYESCGFRVVYPKVEMVKD